MDLAQHFLEPQNTAHRQYEALRAYFVQRLPAAEVAKRFGYTTGSLHQLAHQFRNDPQRQFFVEAPKPGVKSDDNVRQKIVELRKQNLSVYDISRALKKEDIQRSAVAIGKLLKEEGFAKLPRRADEERPEAVRPTQADRADVRSLSLEPRTVHTKFGGLFLFLPMLVEMGFNRVIGHCGLPGTKMVPAACAIRSLLALKLQGNRRHTHVMSAVLDEGLALFAGLNVIPKRSFLTEYSCRLPPACYPQLTNTDLRKEQQNDEILAFARYWKKRTGKFPGELIFDSKLTTQANLNQLNRQGIEFITLRRRGPKLLEELDRHPRSAWRRIELSGVSRIYKTPRILDRQVALDDYEGPIRQIAVKELGHEEPTLLLTNQLRRSAVKLVERYARRMLIENNIADGVNFFHMDSLSSAVALKVNCDVQLTLMASSLYRYLGQQIGQGYETAKSQHLFGDFIDATARLEIDERTIWVHYQKRAHNPLLLAAGFDKTEVRVPWLGKRLRFVFG